MMIRRMTTYDIQSVAALEKQSFTLPWSEMSYKEGLGNKNHIYLVAEENRAVIGCCGMSMVAPEGEILRVAVASDMRGKGTGTALVQCLMDVGRMAGMKEFFLEVRESNHAAIGLYQKLSFEKAGRRRKYYVLPTEDAIIMHYMQS